MKPTNPIKSIKPIQSIYVYVLCAMLCACSAPPTPSSPDGSTRQPVNAQRDIDAYRARLAEPDHAAQQPGTTAQRITRLELQLSKLQQRLDAIATVSANTIPHHRCRLQC